MVVRESDLHLVINSISFRSLAKYFHDTTVFPHEQFSNILQDKVYKYFSYERIVWMLHDSGDVIITRNFKSQASAINRLISISLSIVYWNWLDSVTGRYILRNLWLKSIPVERGKGRRNRLKRPKGRTPSKYPFQTEREIGMFS